VKSFNSPTQFLGNLSALTAANIVETATDIALVVDGDGVIQDVAFPRSDLASELGGYGKWLGKPWAETISPDSRPKVAELLKEAVKKHKTGWRQLHHPSTRGVEVPILYAAVRLGHDDRCLALGRDLRPMAELQHKLIEAQMTMERDYARLRQVEARYRLLFQLSSEAALIVDVGTQKILEANPAAIQLFGGNPKTIIGRVFPEGFDAESNERLRALVNSLRGGGNSGDVHARLRHDDLQVAITASLFRQDVSSMILVRILPTSDPTKFEMRSVAVPLTALAEKAPDGLVVTDRDARILATNAAFAEMAQLTGEEQARGETLGRWLGRPGIDLDVLIANLRQNETVRLFATILRGEFGTTADIEVSAVPLAHARTSYFGFAIRDVGRRLSPNPRAERDLPRSAEQLAELIGRVPLKDLVRETTDVIERLCIEAALSLTANNRASAAELLGVSRQSLYVKLRRFGLAATSDEGESPGP
jgi:transcriptional regulator PpsR